jgi:hypothetical protein
MRIWFAARLRTSVLLGTVTAVACSGPSTLIPTDAQNAVSSVGSQDQEQAVFLRGLNAHFKRLSDEAPGFAGLSVNPQGGVTISVGTDDFSAQSIDRVVSWAKRVIDSRLTSSSISLTRVKYTFATLFQRYQQVHAAFDASEDILSTTGVDGARGVILLGVKDLSAVGPLRSRIASLGIPDDMIQFEEIPLAHANATLEDRFRPLIGGLKVRNSGGIPCSLGFNVMRYDTGTDPYTSQLYFWTAGHCSGNWGVTSNYSWWQGGTGFLQQDLVANEYEVVPKRTGTNCPPSKSPCVAADVVVARYVSGLTFPDSVKYGWVANVNSSRTIITPWYNVQPSVMGAVPGQTVTMVGYASGKKTGTLLQSCQDVQVANPSGGTMWVLCVERANYTAVDGDSGAPIFIPYNPNNPLTPAIVGIHSATGGSNRYFSGISAIDDALNHAYYFW